MFKEFVSLMLVGLVLQLTCAKPIAARTTNAATHDTEKTAVGEIAKPHTIGMPQESVESDADQWAVVKAVPVGERLVVRLKSGKTVAGRVLNVSDTTVKLTSKNVITDVGKQDAHKIYRVFADADEPKLLGSIGGAVGLVAGIILAVGIGLNERTRNTAGTRIGLAVLTPAATIGGVLAGKAIGKQMARELIYEAKQQPAIVNQPGASQP